MGFGVTGLIQSLGGVSDSDIYGTRPDVPKLRDLGAIALEQAESNIANLPTLKQLGEMSTDALADLMERAMPGYKTLRDSTTDAIQNVLTGQATDYERNTLRRLGAELGVESGAVGGDFGNYKTLGVGLQFLNQRTQQGLASAQQWIAQSQNRTFDFTKMFINDPFGQQDREFQRDWLEAQVKAAPDPGARGAFDSEMAFIGMVLSAYGGGAGYTGGYQGGSQQQQPVNDANWQNVQSDGSFFGGGGGGGLPF